MATYDVIVIGTGGVGSSAALHLAERGCRVLGLDRFPPGHDQGSSHGETRVIRQAYFEHPDYVPILREAYALWDQLEQHTGQALFRRVGLLEVGPADGIVVPGVLRSAEAYGLDIERWTPEEVTRRFPAFCLPDEASVVFEKNAGFLMVEDCVKAHCELAERHGATLRHGVEVREIRAAASHVEVVTSTGTERAERVAVAAGAWSARILAELGLPLRVRRKHLHWLAAPSNAYQCEAGYPAYFFEIGRDFFYGFPQLNRLNQGVKVAEHTGGVDIVDPLQDDKRVDPLDRQRIAQFVARHLPEVDSTTWLRHAVCYYTLTPDEHFIVDTVPGSAGRIAFVAGLSGHGFKFTSALGKILSELALDGATASPIEFLRLRRFSHHES